MAGNIYAWSTTAATNASADATINWAEGQMPSTVNDSARAMMAVEAAFLGDTDATLTTGGTGSAYTVTSNLTPAALATGLKLRLKANALNTGACTLTVTPNGAAAFAAKAIRILSVGGDADPSPGMIQTNGIYDFNYDAAANGAAGAWILLNPAYGAYSGNGPPMLNGALAVTAGSSALTIALKTKAGADPSGSDPVIFFFRNVAGATGDYTAIAVSAATSLVISSGSTLGVTSSTAFRIWIVGFNDGGTFRLGAVQRLSGTGLNANYSMSALMDGFASSTAEGGAGAADSAGVIYTGTAVTSKAMRILGYAEWNATGLTAGTWTTTNMTVVHLFGPGTKKPGEEVQSISALFATENVSTTSGTFVTTNTTVTITPTAAANLLKITAGAILTGTGPGFAVAQLSRGTTAATNMTGAMAMAGATGATAYSGAHLLARDVPNTASAQAYNVQIKSLSAGTNVNWGNGGVALIEAVEIMA